MFLPYQSSGNPRHWKVTVWAHVDLINEGMSFKQIGNGGPYIMQIFRIFQTPMGLIVRPRPYIRGNTVNIIPNITITQICKENAVMGRSHSHVQ